MSQRSVVFVSSAAAMGGVEFSTVYLAQRLSPARWRPLVICPARGSLWEECQHASLPCRILPRPALRSTSFRVHGDLRLPNPCAWTWDMGVLLAAARTLARHLADLRPDLVVTKGLFAHLYGGLAARQLGLRCIWHVQDLISERFWGLYRRMFGVAARWLPDAIIADGSPIARQLPQCVQDRVAVILNGVDTEVFRPGLQGVAVRDAWGIARDELVIGHVARLTPWKGQHHLLEAFAQLAATYQHTRLVFVGAPVFDDNSYERRLRERTRALSLTDRVVFAGYRTDLPQVLAAMDIFAYPSVEKDTSPLALLSALAAGRPTIAFDIEGVREVMDGAGRLVPVTSSTDLAEAINVLVEDADQRNHLAHLARQRAESHFSLNSHTRQMEAVFERVASGVLRCSYPHA
ncbi:MAG: glycosyltransferase family 4 protein [Anaerolineae bacterium]|nr:glycosyltransferase family 4 protein [Anaerolineae bacterium]